MSRICSLSVIAALLILLPSQARCDQPSADDGKLRIICFGPHPDDAEYKSGGTAALWAALGHHVKLVSVTNGDIGHWEMAGGPLAKRRTAESAEVAKRLGVHSEVLDIHDGELMPTLENRKIITRLIREWNADIVIAHRPWAASAATCTTGGNEAGRLGADANSLAPCSPKHVSDLRRRNP